MVTDTSAHKKRCSCALCRLSCHWRRMRQDRRCSWPTGSSRSLRLWRTKSPTCDPSMIFEPWLLSLNTHVSFDWVVDPGLGQEDESDQWTASGAKKKTQKNRKKKESRRRVKASSWTKTKTPTKLLFSSCRDTWHPPQLQDLQRGESKRETRAYTRNKMDKNGQVTGNVLEGRLQSHRDALCYYFYKCVVLVHLKCVVFIIRRVCMCKLSLANSSIN